MLALLRASASSGRAPVAAGRRRQPAAEPRQRRRAGASRSSRSGSSDYVALHKKLEATLPSLPKKRRRSRSTQHQRALGALIQDARTRRQAGRHLHAGDAARSSARCCARVFHGPEGAPAQDAIMDENPGREAGASTAAIPTTVPLSTVPPQVLQALPETARGARVPVHRDQPDPARRPRPHHRGLHRKRLPTRPRAISMTHASRVDATLALRPGRRLLVARLLAIRRRRAGVRVARGPRPAPRHAHARRCRTSRTRCKFAVLGDFGTGERAAVRARRADGERVHDAVPVRAGHHRRRQHLRLASGRRTSRRSSRSLQAAARRRREVLRLARQSRRARAALLQAVQHGRQAVLLVQGAEGRTSGSSRSRAPIIDPEQIAWLEKELQESSEDWKIPYFHHPLYSSGERHGSRRRRFAKCSSRCSSSTTSASCSTGHDHFYERIKPQKGIVVLRGGIGRAAAEREHRPATRR